MSVAVRFSSSLPPSVLLSLTLQAQMWEVRGKATLLAKDGEKEEIVESDKFGKATP